MPVLALNLGPQPGRSLELQTHELGAFRRKQGDARLLIRRRNLAPAAEDRVPEHGGPFNLDQEREPAADVPDRVDR